MNDQLQNELAKAVALDTKLTKARVYLALCSFALAMLPFILFALGAAGVIHF